MPYCPRCGVETDPSIRSCPLCKTVLPVFDDLGPGEPAWPSPGEVPHDPAQSYPTSGELRSRAFLAVVGVFLTAAVAVTAPDLFTTGALTWSRWPLVSLAAALVFTAAVFAWHRRPRLWLGAGAFVVVGLLAALDLCGGTWGWFPRLGLPIAVVTGALAWAGVEIVRRNRRRGYNLFGLVPALVALELLAIDALVAAWTTGQPVLSWSLVTALVLGPLVVLFFSLHYALRRTPDLRRIFHF